MKATVSPGRRQRLAEVAIALGLFLLALAFQLAIFDRWAGYTDEGRVVQTAAEINRGKVLYRDINMPDPGPGAFYLLAWILRHAGTSFEVSRLAIAAMSSAMAPLLYGLARGAVSRWPAMLVGLSFPVCRLWGFPNWLFFYYGSCAVFFTTLAFALFLPTLERRRLLLTALGGAACAVGIVCKQDIGATSLAGLGLAALLSGGGSGRMARLAALGAGALAVAVPVLVYFASEQALEPLFDQTVRTPILGRAISPPEYEPRLPNLLPLLSQDAALRALAGQYSPSILVSLYWDRLTQSALYRTTAVWDVAIKCCYFLPYILLAASALVVGLSWRSRGGPASTTRPRRVRATLLVVFAAATLAAFNPPRDWVHLLAVYHPSLVLGGLLLDRAVGRLGRRMRRALLLLATAGVIAALALAIHLTRDLRRRYDTPVATATGTVWLPADEAKVLADLLAYVEAETGPGDPLPVFPYFPLLQFFAGRTAGTSSYFIWPVRPRDDTDVRLIAELEASRPPTIIYSVSQYEHFRLFRVNAPALFAYLVDHYDITRTFTPPAPWGTVFCALGRKRPLPPPLVDLEARLDGAVVSVSGAAGTRVLTGAERARAVGRALWPFKRVVYERPAHRGTTAVAFPVRVPPEASLRFDYGLDPDRWVSFKPAAVTFSVSVALAGEPERVLFSDTVDPQRRPAERSWRAGSVDLTDLAGSEVVLSLRTTTDGPAGEEAGIAGWAAPRLVRIGADRSGAPGAAPGAIGALARGRQQTPWIATPAVR